MRAFVVAGHTFTARFPIGAPLGRLRLPSVHIPSGIAVGDWPVCRDAVQGVSGEYTKRISCPDRARPHQRGHEGWQERSAQVPSKFASSSSVPSHSIFIWSSVRLVLYGGGR